MQYFNQNKIILRINQKCNFNEIILCNIDVFFIKIKEYSLTRKMDYKWINSPSRRGKSSKTPWITLNLLLLSLILANNIWQTQGKFIRDRGQWIGWIKIKSMRCVWKWNRFGTSLLAFDIEKQRYFVAQEMNGIWTTDSDYGHQ